MAPSDDSLLGPSNSSDSGSDRAGATRQPGMPDPQTPLDKALREDAPRSPLPEQVMSIEAEPAVVAPDPADERLEPTTDDPDERNDEEDEERPTPEQEPHPTQAP
jgi:hypothetical protein